MIGPLSDISTAHQDSFYRQLLENIHDGVYFVDMNRIITFWNKGAERITGFTAEEVIGSGCRDNILVHVDAEGNELCSSACPLLLSATGDMPGSADVYLHHKDGHRVAVSVQASPVKDGDGTIIGAIESFRETSAPPFESLEFEELQRLALLDPLTETANRRYLEMKLQADLDKFQRYGIGVGVIFADIDHFKAFNDTYGHGLGDDILRVVARTLQGNVRSSDLAGRWGGEEFLIVVPHADAARLARLAEKLRRLVESCFVMHQEQRVTTTISMGTAVAHQGDTLEGLLERADQMLYKAKRAGRNCIMTDQQVTGPDEQTKENAA
ncbi:sensor domain-containing diguanylate cyclase [Trichlorobacter lovleyi]|jgi:diguanylate cyclase with PAS/PAC sensor|uniref:diguanylate cyclase n=1 Tax=Trichlorobacter lovleyi (strain ATCC BAA-1151 / DSM 17278 / SZ) TaxID=398767 RepID=B3E708_TRIL1|nr:diguanylate cyclase [Trichlorobacter lovleyi]ACD96413.1 diguanylate cyclase with PAS/PAC sensor [Trichlorobacter lovleyi SZ]